MRLSPEKLEFYKYFNSGEGGVGIVTGGIASFEGDWMLDGIVGTNTDFSAAGSLSALNDLNLSGTLDVDINFKDGSTTNWILRNDISEGDDFVIRTGSQSTPALQLSQSTNGAAFGGTVLPASSSIYNLGSSSKRWLTVYAIAVNTLSDRRFKEKISDLEYGLDALMELRPVSYDLKADHGRGRQLGLIAQELRQVIPEVVTEADDEMKSLGVDYLSLIPVLIASLQEQQKQIEAQGQLIAHQAQDLSEIRAVLAAQAVKPPGSDLTTAAVSSDR